MRGHKIRGGALALCLLLAWSSLGMATTLEVTFLPQGVLITEQAKLPFSKIAAQLGTATFTIPGNVDPHQLAIQVIGNPDARLMDYDWQPLSASQDERAITLRKRQEELKGARLRLQSSLRALEGQLLFWQHQAKGRVKNIGEAGGHAAIIGKNIQRLNIEKGHLEAALSRVEGQLAQGDPREGDWLVTCYVEGKPGREVTMRYTYLLPGGGWTPYYRLEAHPERNEVLLTYQGEIVHHSPGDWTNVTLRIAPWLPVKGEKNGKGEKGSPREKCAMHLYGQAWHRPSGN